MKWRVDYSQKFFMLLYNPSSSCSDAIINVIHWCSSYLGSAPSTSRRSWIVTLDSAEVTTTLEFEVTVKLLKCLENWFSDYVACVGWHDCWSDMFIVNSGVRQSIIIVSVVIYIDDMISSDVFIIAYADDILLLTPSVTALQNLFRLQPLNRSDMTRVIQGFTHFYL